MSKNKPQISKKNHNNNNQNNNGTNNRYEDIFTQNPNAQKNQAKDPFDFVLDYDQSFLRDDNSNKHNIDNQFNTRRSRCLLKIF